MLSLIVAADESNVIGKENKLPWFLPNDLKYFKNQTWGMPVVMGRKTFESLGKPLPGRKSIVITRSTSWQYPGVEVVNSVNDAIEKAKEQDVLEVFIIGGAEIFQSAFAAAGRIYLTRIHHHFDGDVFFPEMDQNDWNLIQSKFCSADDKNAYAHTFQVWERVKKTNGQQ